jgi:hypothetical protein
MEKQSIWQKQEALKRWHSREYRQEYPNSEFYTGRKFADSDAKYEAFSEAEKERKEQLAHRLNCMLFSIGVNIGPFQEEVLA